MKFLTTVYVKLKPGYSDPEGETTVRALQGLGYDIEQVRVSKAYELVFKAKTDKEAEVTVDEICRRLLTNPTKDDYRFEIREMQ